MSDDKGTTAPGQNAISESDFNKAQDRARTLEAQLADVQKSLKRWEGFDPDVVRGKLEDYELMRQEKAGNPEEIQRLVSEKETEIEGRFSSRLTETEKERDTLRQELRKLQVLNPALQAIGPECTKDGLSLIAPIIERELAIVDGEICVVDSDGKAVPSEADPRIKRMGIEEYKTQLKSRFPSVFSSQSKGGAKGAGQSMGGSEAGGISADKYLSMSASERAQIPDPQRRQLAAKALGMKIAQPQQGAQK